MSQSKRQIYFNEFIILMEKATYLPLVSGLLRAHAEESNVVRDHYEFKPFLFHIDAPDRILDQYEEPYLAAFSVSMWNGQLSLRVARQVKERFPRCLVVFGGAQVPHAPAAFFEKHAFVDVAVRGEGEESFTGILERLAEGQNLDELPGVSWRTPSGEVRLSDQERPFNRDLDVYPSPYLNGLFDKLMEDRRDLTFQAIVETNRGCPFHCTFCYWGKGGLSRKYRYHSMERVAAEIDWIGEHQVRYVFNADSNFGMHKRDLEIANLLVDVKKKYGYPEKFRTCYGKNTDENIYAIGTLLHKHALEKGITISYQSTDQQVQNNIKRHNIKMDFAKELNRRFNDDDVPVYTELILGLPGETVESWIKGIDDILQSGLKNQLFIYICQVFPNTDLAEPDYQEKFGIRTRRIELTEIHGSVRRRDWVPEFEDIVIATNSMPTEEWRRMLMFSWVMMLLHSLKLGFFVLAYLADRYGVRYSDFLSYVSFREFPRNTGAMIRNELAEFDRKIDRLLAGEGRGCTMPDHGGIYWDEEEASFLRLSEDFDRFFDELLEILRAFLKDRGIKFDDDELVEVVRYQRMRVPTPTPPAITQWAFSRNIPGYFDAYFGTSPVPLKPTAQVLEVHPVDYDGDQKRFARESILWGRKSGLMLTKVRWFDS